MPAVLRRSQAEDDLFDIWDYISHDSVEAADRFVDEIDGKLTMLAENPLMGRAREELAVGLQSFPVGSYVVFYRPIRDGIEVIRVLHGRRDVAPESLL